MVGYQGTEAASRPSDHHDTLDNYGTVERKRRRLNHAMMCQVWTARSVGDNAPVSAWPPQLKTRRCTIRLDRNCG